MYVAVAQCVDSLLGGPVSTDAERAGGILRDAHLPNQKGRAAAGVSRAARRASGGSVNNKAHCMAVARAFVLATLLRAYATHLVQQHVDVVLDAPCVPYFADDTHLAVDSRTFMTLIRTAVL
jgi:hypothetical protein